MSKPAVSLQSACPLSPLLSLHLAYSVLTAYYYTLSYPTDSFHSHHSYSHPSTSVAKVLFGRASLVQKNKFGSGIHRSIWYSFTSLSISLPVWAPRVRIKKEKNAQLLLPLL
jgi:hypothetical protein